MADNKYGKIIQKYRSKVGITQSDLAKKLGVSANCVSAWEVGRNEPNMGMVAKMAKIFGCTVSDLMGLEPFPESKSVEMAKEIAKEYEKETDPETTLYSTEEILLVKAYRSLPEAQQREALLHLMKLMAERK